MRLCFSFGFHRYIDQIANEDRCLSFGGAKWQPQINCFEEAKCGIMGGEIQTFLKYAKLLVAYFMGLWYNKYTDKARALPLNDKELRAHQ